MTTNFGAGAIGAVGHTGLERYGGKVLTWKPDLVAIIASFDRWGG
jgi:hypothetical protein